MCAFSVQKHVARARELQVEKFIDWIIMCNFRQVSSGMSMVGEEYAGCCGEAIREWNVKVASGHAGNGIILDRLLLSICVGLSLVLLLLC